MSQGEDCRRCSNFSGYEDEGFLVCGMYPTGPETIPCHDWELSDEDGWFLADEAEVNGERVLAQADLLEALARDIEVMLHPRLTGRCPECGFEFDRCRLPTEYWDCDKCGWMDT